MLYFIQNNNYKVGVDSRGAELKHFVKLDEQLELIWQGNPEIWASSAPTLFPIVGELPNQQYEFEGQTYHMKRHGFARHKEFKVVDHEKDKLVFELNYDDETLEQFPFKFSLLVAFKLEENKLGVSYLVRSEDDKAMYFSVGGHPGFNVPLYPNEQFEDYFIEFDQEETLSRYLLSDEGLLNGTATSLMEATNMLPLSHNLFEKDAIVLKDVISEKVTLGSRTNPLKIEIAFKGFPFLGIWSKPGPAPFVCIEPWCGVASRVGESGLLQEKEGIQQLGPKQSFERTFFITVTS